ncbi:aldo/keto reductase [Streptomyces atratus]|uniref:aldo/keto reductase n=1 Tax=Streptomyces atratus TaxID=1893 RepID=UPI0037B86F57
MSRPRRAGETGSPRLPAALRSAEESLTAQISSRLTAESIERLVALVAAGTDQDDAAGTGGGTEGVDALPVLGKIKEAPGNVSLETMLTEIDKLLVVRAIGLPPDLFIDVAPKVVAGWRARAAVELPSHLRTHPVPLRVTLLAALLHEREREITDTLVELLISTVHRIGARAEKKVTEQLINAFKKVSGKENILFKLAEASLGTPEGTVRQVVFQALAERHGIEVRAAALQFSLAHPATAAAVPGARKPSRIAEDLAALDETIPAAFWTALREEKLIADSAPVPAA